MAFMKKEQEESVIDEFQDEKTITDSSVLYEKQKREEFNSEMDMYSETESVPDIKKMRRGTIIAKQSLIMKSIPAENSDEEKGSDDYNSNNNSQQDQDDGEEREGEEQEEEYDFEEQQRNESGLDERQ